MLKFLKNLKLLVKVLKNRITVLLHLQIYYNFFNNKNNWHWKKLHER